MRIGGGAKNGSIPPLLGRAQPQVVHMAPPFAYGVAESAKKTVR
jgi:hypothetical protein